MPSIRTPCENVASLTATRRATTPRGRASRRIAPPTAAGGSVLWPSWCCSVVGEPMTLRSTGEKNASLRAGSSRAARLVWIASLAYMANESRRTTRFAARIVCTIAHARAT